MASILDQVPYNNYTGNGVVTAYPFEFELLDAGDFVASIDGVEVPSSDYTLSGLTQAGGTCTFDTAPANLAAVLLQRLIALERDTDYQYNGDLREATLDRDFNRLWQALQGQLAQLGGALRLPYPEQADELPPAADRLGKLLSFNASTGARELVAPSAGTATALALQLADPTNTSNGDALVAAKRDITDAVAATLHTVNELRAYSPEDVGAPVDGVTDDAPYVQKLYDHIRITAGRGKIVLTPGKLYYFNSQITYADNSALVGTGAKIKVGTGFAGINKPLLKNFIGTQFSDNSTRIASTNVSFIDLEFDGQSAGVNGTTVADANMRGVLICAGTWYANSGVDGFTVHNCNMYSFAGAGAMAWKSTNVRITSNRFNNFFANTALSIGSCIDLHECERFGIINNKINHTAAGLSWHGMVVLDWDDGSKDGIITANVITNMNGGDGISCEGNGGAGSNLERCTVSDNTIYNCNGQGIGVDGCVSVTVHGNRIKSVIGPGILYTGTTRANITNNDVDGSALGGIVGQSGCVDAIIVGNKVRAITYTSASYRGIGIEFANSALSASTSCIIGNNIISDCDGPGVYAEVFGATVSGNRVNSCGVTASLANTLRAGIVAMEHSVVVGNFIRSNGSAHYAISSVAANFPTLGTNDITGTFLTAYYYIGYRFSVSMNVSATIYKATYDAESDVFVGWFNGTPSGAWKICDIMYDTTPSAGGFIGSVCTNTTGPVWKTFGAISA